MFPPVHHFTSPACHFKAICLLESPPSTDALCDLLFSQLAGGRAELASAWARLAALLYHYRPPRGRVETVLCPSSSSSNARNEG